MENSLLVIVATRRRACVRAWTQNASSTLGLLLTMLNEVNGLPTAREKIAGQRAAGTAASWRPPRVPPPADSCTPASWRCYGGGCDGGHPARAMRHC